MEREGIFERKKCPSEMSTTKALAIKYGKIRSRLIESFGSDKKDPATKGAQPFRYFLILDFESTCWEDKGFAPPEIIEFPCVLLDSDSGEVIEEFRNYVIPTERPQLSSFCTKLTGITQDTLQDSGIPIGTALYLFGKWISELNSRYGLIVNGFDSDKAGVFVTWSSWDLGVCLEGELKRKQIVRPKIFNSWIDIRDVYSRFYCRRPEGLNGALKDLGLSFEGREHSGLDDAKNTAMLVYRMIKDGCTLGITKSISGVNVPEKYKAPADLMSGKPSHAPSLRKKTPRSLSKKSGPKKTPPMCSCGKRARCLRVSKLGPNTGRSFFACTKKLCRFFQWVNDVSLGQSAGLPSKIRVIDNKENESSFFKSTKIRPVEINFKIPLRNHNPKVIPPKSNKYFGNVSLHPEATAIVHKPITKRTLGLKNNLRKSI